MIEKNTTLCPISMYISKFYIHIYIDIGNSGDYVEIPKMAKKKNICFWKWRYFLLTINRYWKSYTGDIYIYTYVYMISPLN